jgi:hypothetical protein
MILGGVGGLVCVGLWGLFVRLFFGFIGRYGWLDYAQGRGGPFEVATLSFRSPLCVEGVLDGPPVGFNTVIIPSVDVCSYRLGQRGTGPNGLGNYHYGDGRAFAMMVPRKDS